MNTKPLTQRQREALDKATLHLSSAMWGDSIQSAILPIPSTQIDEKTKSKLNENIKNKIKRASVLLKGIVDEI